MAATFVQLLGLAALASAIVLLILIAAIKIFGLLSQRGPNLYQSPNTAEAILLFDGEQLLDASPSASNLLRNLPDNSGNEWRQLMAWATRLFPDVLPQIRDLRYLGKLSFGPDPEHGFCLRAEWRNGLAKILISNNSGLSGPHGDPLTTTVRESELIHLRALLTQAPFPLWSGTADGVITSVNSAYLNLITPPNQKNSAPPWPLPALFSAEAESATRSKITDAAGKDRYFQTHYFQTGGLRTGFALPVDETERAEQALSSFVRTLALTFASLPIGLAVFDQDGRLRLFNPALTDLTTLPVDFLAMQPKLFAFLDAMRARERLPEPRDYFAWRGAIAAVSHSPDGSPYEEIWALPNGQTLQIVAHCHAAGALTLLIQDISGEIIRSRRLRHDIALGQSAIDNLDDAIAVFSASGQLQLSNAAFAALYTPDNTDTVLLLELPKLWSKLQSMSAANPFWTQVIAWTEAVQTLPPLRGEIRMRDGSHLQIVLCSLPDLATMVTLRSVPKVALQALTPEHAD